METRALLLLATLASPANAAGLLGDAAKGEAEFRACRVCHEVGPGAAHRTGPVLNGVFGRSAGTASGFSYSDGMRRAGADGVVWDLETLDAFVEQPKSIVSKTRMNFPGVKDPSRRADLLAYLRQFSDNPRDIPGAEATASPTDHAVDPAILAIRGDPDYGAYLSGDCVTCHQRDGTAEGIPSITGWAADDFVIAMQAYKAGKRPHPVMRMMAGRLSDEEIASLAAYFETLE